jgi:Domain of unknown function (DUF4440)
MLQRIVQTVLARRPSLSATTALDGNCDWGDEHDVVARVNQELIEALLRGNLTSLRDVLAEDFTCTLADGQVLRRAELLDELESGKTPKSVAVGDVAISIARKLANLRARVDVVYRDGTLEQLHSTQVFGRHNNTWQLLFAQLSLIS